MVYLTKIEKLRELINAAGSRKKIIDLGCGEGVLVKEFADKGFNIVGIDLNYQSKYVRRGNILKLNLPQKKFDLILCLDVLEHLNFFDQKKAIEQIDKVLRPGGKVILSVPNLAHLASRFAFFFLGRLLRTSTIDRHPGDRPLSEFLSLLKEKFKDIKVVGLFPTLPLISIATILFPAKVVWWHRFYNRFFAWPTICFENIIIARK